MYKLTRQAFLQILPFVSTGIMKSANFKPTKLQRIAGAATAPAFAVVSDQEQLPSFDGSQAILVLFLFPTAPTPGARYYFPQDSRIDNGRITSLRTHFSYFTDLDMSAQYQYNGVNYNVIDKDDYVNVLITLSHENNSQPIQRMPAATFTTNFTVPALPNPVNPKLRKALSLKHISTIKSFIEFSQVPTVTSTPFVIPMNLYYSKK